MTMVLAADYCDKQCEGVRDAQLADQEWALMHNYDEEHIVDIDVTAEMETSFLEYAYSVIYSRALPDARDGLKPVQRRILFSMDEMGIRPDRSHVKCARVVGQVMGALHPHGDGAIYDALVRIAQPWSMRLPLVDGHGNFGSLDAGPAAMRYTECRMDTPAVAMTTGLDEETVDFKPNYDGKEVEPEVLPAAFPNLLVNGATGIAVGMATNIAPHNLVEVVAGLRQLIANPDITVEELMLHIPGPDFPAGGKIIGLDGIRDAYETGRGSFKIRATSRIEKVSPRRQGIVVTELPYMIGPERIIEQIKKGVGDKKLTGIADVKDLTDLERGTRLVIEVKNGINPEALLQQLYKQTKLEDTFSINAVALVEGQPRTLGLKDMLEVYLGHRREVIRRRTECRLDKAQARLHLVEGLMIAILDIDDVIAIIRSSDDAAEARARLMGAFDLSETQANYILDMQLRRLTKFSTIELEKEAKELREQIARLREILDDPTELDHVLVSELDDVAKRFGTPRRTSLQVDHDLNTPRTYGVAGITGSGNGAPLPAADFRIECDHTFHASPTRDNSALAGEEDNVRNEDEYSIPRHALNDMWDAIVLAHPNAKHVRFDESFLGGDGEGCLYVVLAGDAQISAVLASSLGAAWAHVTQNEASFVTPERAIWVHDSRHEIIRSSPMLSRLPGGPSALRPGRPRVIKDEPSLREAPTTAGIYRIYRMGHDGLEEVYIGRTSNFRRRLPRHEVLYQREWGGYPGSVSRVEILPAKTGSTQKAWTSLDLDAEEEKHIERARTRSMVGGPRVLNRTIGRNGPPSSSPARLIIWPAQ